MATVVGSPTLHEPWHRTELAPRQAFTAGSALNTSSSASAVLLTLGPVLAYAVGWFAAFILLRRLFTRNYSPRSVLATLPPQHRIPELPKGWFNWIGVFWRISDTHVLNTQSLDGFLFLRLLKISVVTCLVGCLITWPVLFPINITGSGGQHQLDILSFGNAAGTNTNDYYRYYAHVGCAYLFFGFVLYMITRESIYYINLRQAYLISPLYADRISSKTVMFTSVPEFYQNEALLRELLGRDKVVNVWIHRDTKALEEKVKERDKIAMKLEAAEIKLIRTANAARLKAVKKSDRPVTEINDADYATTSGSVASKWIKPKQRPTHRLKFLIGKKVDTIDWCRSELARLIPEVKKMQDNMRHGKGKPTSCCFVEFVDLREAQSAFQSLTHHQPLHMAPRFTGVVPEEIIWSNMRIKWWERIIRIIATISIVVALIIFWSIPVAAVGSISNLNYVLGIRWLHWLSFIKKMPHYLLGLITGLLPTIMLAVLMALLPIFLRLMARIGGDPTLSMVEYTVQNTYFAFNVVQVFLVTTLSSGAIAAAKQISRNPTSVVNILADSLPKAANFYLCYFILQGLAVVSQILVSITGLVIFIILGKLLDSSPRKLYNRWASLSDPGLGTTYPIYTNLFVIAICYSCIAPLVLGFAAIGLYFFYIAYRYQFLFVYSAQYDTKGLMYPRALQQLFVGLYLAELCLIGLFAINAGASSILLGPLVLMIIFLVFTALFHISLNTALQPLLNYLPKTLETEERRLLALEEEDGQTEEAGYTDAGQQGTPIGLATSTDHPETYSSATTSAEKDRPTAPIRPPPLKKPGILAKFLRPDIYTDYHTMRRLVPRMFTHMGYSAEVARDAYFHPSITSEPPTLWVVRDQGGVSWQEVTHSSRVIPTSDEAAYLNDSNEIVWDSARANEAPIYEDPVYY